MSRESSVRRRLADEHHKLLHANLTLQIPAFIFLTLVLSPHTPWSRLVLAILIVVGMSAFGLLKLWSVAERSVAERIRGYVVVNAVSGVAWGAAFWVAIPVETEAQLFLASILPFAMIASMFEAAPLKRSFIAFHIPFTIVVSLAYAISASGMARWSSVLFVAVSVYVWAFASVVRKNAIERVELLVQNQELIGELHDTNAVLERLSTEDSLTGLPNRMAFDRFFAAAFAEHERAGIDGKRSRVAAIYIDLDRFKLVNDNMGHEVGDELLTHVARRLRTVLPDETFLGRVGGDELIAVSTECASSKDAQALGESIVVAASQPFRLSRGKVEIGASVGVALSSPSCRTPADLLRNADTALYEAKAAGGGRVVVFDGHRADSHQDSTTTF